jgi:hypothetical protein
MNQTNYQSAEWGYLYCLSNPSLPGMVKIGMTIHSPFQRAKQLSNTSIPTPYHVEFAKFVQYPYAKEQQLHQVLQEEKKRVHKNREHFHLTVDQTIAYFERIEGKWDPPPSTFSHKILQTPIKQSLYPVLPAGFIVQPVHGLIRQERVIEPEQVMIESDTTSTNTTLSSAQQYGKIMCMMTVILLVFGIVLWMIL